MSGPALVSGQSRYILVVDGDRNERFTLSMLLQRFGYAVASSSSAAEGIEFLCVAPAMAVFADEGEEGEDLARRLRGDARFRDIPLVMVADGPHVALEERSGKESVAGLVRAPLSADTVYRLLQKVIEKGNRENIRIPTALRAQVHDEYGATEGYATVLSQYGLFFRTLEPRPVNSSVTVVLSIDDRTVRAEAQVLYIVSFEEGPFSEPGMGMKFVRIGAEDSALLRFFIYERLDARRLPSAPGHPTGSA
jgi:CheY-like chemotaxis protein